MWDFPMPLATRCLWSIPWRCCRIKGEKTANDIEKTLLHIVVTSSFQASMTYRRCPCQERSTNHESAAKRDSKWQCHRGEGASVDSVSNSQKDFYVFLGLMRVPGVFCPSCLQMQPFVHLPSSGNAIPQRHTRNFSWINSTNMISCDSHHNTT